MPIPSLTKDGVLPVGLHECDLSELLAVFGVNPWMPVEGSETYREKLCPNRGNLAGYLSRYLTALRESGLKVLHVLVDGSFVTDKPDPNDIDLIVVMLPEHDFDADLSPVQYDLVSKEKVRRNGYPFDIVICGENDPNYQLTLNLFQQVRKRAELAKGLLKVIP